MAINNNVIVQYNGGFLPDILLLTQAPIVIGNGYFQHRSGILLFAPPPGSRARRLGWSQYMHECVGASQGYHGVVGGLGLGLGLAVG